MPIYEYESLIPEEGCKMCFRGFEHIQTISSPALTNCPGCGLPVRRIISRCHGAISEASPEHQQVEARIAHYEREGMWSHAAELADKHSERIKDPGLKTRALDDYKKAGYSIDTLEKHAKSIEE
ncbi:MAG: zinc ribbon domain-containing protein [Desulfobacteraceae bacterium]|nr:MAG: zinc ribbon domain-containing protein [Desulfobacteraceae bacterium]